MRRKMKMHRKLISLLVLSSLLFALLGTALQAVLPHESIMPAATAALVCTFALCFLADLPVPVSVCTPKTMQAVRRALKACPCSVRAESSPCRLLIVRLVYALLPAAVRAPPSPPLINHIFAQYATLLAIFPFISCEIRHIVVFFI